MFESIKRLYISGRLSDDGLRRAVELRFITEAQLQEIVESK